jgi:hypothetical protein
MESEAFFPCSQEPDTGPYYGPDCIQSTVSHPISRRSILILSSYLRLGLPNSIFPSGFNTKIVYVFLPSPHACYIPRPSHRISFDHRNAFSEEYKVWSSLVNNFLHLIVTSSVLGPNILLSTLFSDALNLCSVNARDHVSHPYKTTGRITVPTDVVEVSGSYLLITDSRSLDPGLCCFHSACSPQEGVPQPCNPVSVDSVSLPLFSR